MNWSMRIRNFHRWMALLFVLVVIANFVAIGMGQQIMWLYYVPLVPLALLALTGLYLFVLPYAQRMRAGSRTGA
jgi:hypothetical protein